MMTYVTYVVLLCLIIKVLVLSESNHLFLSSSNCSPASQLSIPCEPNHARGALYSS